MPFETSTCVSLASVAPMPARQCPCSNLRMDLQDFRTILQTEVQFWFKFKINVLIQVLTLYLYYSAYIQVPPAPPVLPLDNPIFHNLAFLTSSLCTFSKLKMENWIMRSSPMLKKLTLQQQNQCVSFFQNSANFQTPVIFYFQYF